jgi:hypothetical protein
LVQALIPLGIEGFLHPFGGSYHEVNQKVFEQAAKRVNDVIEESLLFIY